jgi:hypothetical protein
MSAITVRVTRPAAEAKRDEFKHIVYTRNGCAQLGGMKFCAWQAAHEELAAIDFLSARGAVLNAGATLPVAWLDQLCVEWAKQRNLWPKVELYQANVTALEEEVAQLKQAMEELAELNFNLAKDGPNARYVYDLKQERETLKNRLTSLVTAIEEVNANWADGDLALALNNLNNLAALVQEELD